LRSARSAMSLQWSVICSKSEECCCQFAEQYSPRIPGGDAVTSLFCLGAARTYASLRSCSLSLPVPAHCVPLQHGSSALRRNPLGSLNLRLRLPRSPLPTSRAQLSLPLPRLLPSATSARHVSHPLAAPLRAVRLYASPPLRLTASLPKLTTLSRGIPTTHLQLQHRDRNPRDFYHGASTTHTFDAGTN
jgi:hypothetical protein